MVLDLFSGLGGATQAMKDRGWRVVTVELEGRFRPSVVADVARLPFTGGRWDLLWASPPCTEFSRESMPWCRTGQPPDLSLVLASIAAVRALRPRWWVIENVRGATRWLTPLLGRPRVMGPFYLWGSFPNFRVTVPPFKEHLSSARRAERARVPYHLSAALADAMECEDQLLGGFWPVTHHP